MAAPWYRWEDSDLLLSVRVQPRSSRLTLEVLADHLRVRLTAPPVDGKANTQLCEFLAETCAVAKSAVSVQSGESGRTKVVRIHAPRRLPPGVAAP